MSPISAMSGSRRLLSSLRDAMASSEPSQERLNKIVSIIASDFVAEVCSIYVLRAGEILELFASKGLAARSIHNTRLQIGEGLIGQIAVDAKPLALADAQSHPNYVYRPETGEEIYHSLVGVPILRGGRVTGVLAVQNQASRSYTEEEVETLETTAMVIAELIANRELLSQQELRAFEGQDILSHTIDGIRFHGGIGIGKAMFHERRIVVSKLVSDDPSIELERLNQAVMEMHGAIDQMLEAKDIVSGGAHKEILETYKVFAEDSGWLSRISESIDKGLTAEAAVEKVRNDTRARFKKQTNEFVRERLLDFEDLATRLLKHLAGKLGLEEQINSTKDFILIARNLGPIELLDYNRTFLKALVLEKGSTASHVAIMARELDIPFIGRAAGIFEKVETGDDVIVDGDNAQIHIRPTDKTQQVFLDTIKSREKQIQNYSTIQNLPSETKDGISIELHLNAGFLTDIQNISITGADGIGLYRTEILFMDSREFPSVKRQSEIYKQIIDQSGDKPIIFRTLDIGGDKGLPYWENDHDENPAMGWRAIRVSLDRPNLLKNQLRALIRASAGNNLSIMFPMITKIEEFDKARNILQIELDKIRMENLKPIKSIHVGVMLEVPALVYEMTELLKRVDFISIGSNDLFQFLFASDRGSTKMADRYDPISLSGLNLLEDIINQCKLSGTPLSLCGEIAGNPLDAMALIGIGFTSLSMRPSAIGPVKTMVRSLSLNDLKNYLKTIKYKSGHSLREKLREFAIDHNVII